MRLCEIVMSGNSIQKGMSWQQTDSSWYVPLLFYHLTHDSHLTLLRTWAWIPVWSQIEVDIGILTACLPCLSPLLRLMWSEVSVTRTMTPSMVELPKYSGSWASADSRESGGEEKMKEVPRREKELPALPSEKEEKVVKVKVSSYYDDASDEEEAREGNVAAKSASKRMEMSRKLS
jgi:hypothetical protein